MAPVQQPFKWQKRLTAKLLDTFSQLIGMSLFGIGLLGEYVGRIYLQVRHRPRYVVEAILDKDT